MKAKEMIYKNELCTAHRVDVYVKRGAYKHGYVKGWELRNNEGEVIVDPRPLTCASAYAYQTARFPKLEDLKSYVEDVNDHHAMLVRRQGIKG